MGTPDALLHCFMDLGEAMLTVGADVNRVEDTLIRMGMAYGAARMNVFVITSSMVVTMTLPDGRDVTQTRRVPSPGGTDMTVLEDLNALSRRCCACLLPAERLTAEIKALTQGGVRPLWAYCGSMLAAGSCTLFFGGTPADGLSAALFGLAICYLQRHFFPGLPQPHGVQSAVLYGGGREYHFVGAFSAGIAVGQNIHRGHYAAHSRHGHDQRRAGYHDRLPHCRGYAAD